MGIIYLAKFQNGKCYVGYTSRNLEQRVKEHLAAADSGSEYLLHKAIRKYGNTAVTWVTIEESQDEKYLLSEREEYHIKTNNSHYTINGYNMTLGGQAGSNKHWYDNLSEEQHFEYHQKLLWNLSKAWGSEARSAAMKESWGRDIERKRATSERFKKLWENENHRKKESLRRSERMKLEYSSGLRSTDAAKKASDAAKMKVAGSKWFNDGIKNYRLFPSDPIVEQRKLNAGKLKK